MFQVDEELFNIAKNEIQCAFDSFSANESLVSQLSSSIPSDFNNIQTISDVLNDYTIANSYTKDLFDKINEVYNKLQNVNIQEGNHKEEKKEEGFFSSIWHSFTDTCSAWGKGFSSLLSGEGFGDLGDALKQTGATIFVTANSVRSGIQKVGECLVDGVTYLGGMAVGTLTGIIDNDKGEKIKNDTMDFIGRDLVGEKNKAFFEETDIGRAINEASNLKYDSSGAKGIQAGTELVGKIALATAATVLSGGTAAIALGAVYGIGSEEEKYAKTVDRENGEEYDLKKSMIKATIGAVGGAAEFYGFGQLGAGVYHGLSALKSGVASTGIEQGMANINTSFSKKFAKSFFVKDTLLDTSAVVTRHGLNYAIGDESFDELVRDGGTELLLSLGLAAAGSSLSAYVDTRGAKKILKTYNSIDEFFDNKTIYTDLDALISNEKLDMSLLKNMSPQEATNLLNKIDANDSLLFHIQGSLNPITDNLTTNQLDDIIKNSNMKALSKEHFISNLNSKQLGEAYLNFSDDTLSILNNSLDQSFHYNVLKDNTISDLAYRKIASDMNDDLFKDYLVNKKMINPTKLSNDAKKYYDWANGEMVQIFKDNDVLKYVDEAKIHESASSIMYLDEDFFSKLNNNPNCVGFFDGKGHSFLKLSDNISPVELKSTSIHETIHSLSAYDGGSGFRIYNSRIDNTGINEAMTELLAQDFSKVVTNDCSYNHAVENLRTLMDLDIDGLNYETMKDAYFSNDSNFLIKKLGNFFGDISYGEQFSGAFNKSINGKYTDLDELVDDLALYISGKRSS